MTACFLLKLSFELDSHSYDPSVLPQVSFSSHPFHAGEYSLVFFLSLCGARLVPSMHCLIPLFTLVLTQSPSHSLRLTLSLFLSFLALNPRCP